MKRIVVVVACVLSSSLVMAQGKLLKRVKQQADVVEQAYGETWDTFYGVGHYKTLMNANLDTRPDGTPNIVLDEKGGKMTVTIRLSVNEANYNAWKAAAHKRFKDANMSFEFSDFENSEGRMIGGKNYKFGKNEEESIQRWEEKRGGEDALKANSKALTVVVTLVAAGNKAVRRGYCPLSSFSRVGTSSFRLPLYNLNRLKDLPKTRFSWLQPNANGTVDANVEDAFARIVFEKMSSEEMNALDEVKCEILDEKDMPPVGRTHEVDNLKYVFDGEGWRVVGRKRDCEKFTIVPEIQGYKVTTIGKEAFERSGLTAVTIPPCVTTIEKRAFACCNLKAVNIPAGVTTIGESAFFRSDIATVTIPESVKTIGDYAFCRCEELKMVTFMSTQVIIGQNLFEDCCKLKAVRIPSEGKIEGMTIPSGCKLMRKKPSGN